MKYGLLGEKLGHSFSKEIHERIASYQYQVIEVAKEALDRFMIARDFKGINVTIPYKEKVIPYLYYLDEKAKEINAVNTIVNNDGKLYGYNTDYYGLKSLIENNEIDVCNKRVLIFGTGGTSKTAYVVLKDLGAKEIIKVSRRKQDGFITYDELVNYKDVDVLVNTTPSGMYPNVDSVPCDIMLFKKLTAIVDVVYNPLNTKLYQNAIKKGIKAVTGLYMLVSQAVYASYIFLNEEFNPEVIKKLTNDVYQELLHKKENIVLIGMPSCGKSTIGKEIALKLNKEFVDSDTEIEKRIGKKISDFLTKDNEEEFRDLESDVIKELSVRNNLVISTGGGVIKRDENIFSLKLNGKVFFIDRPLELLQITNDRPLSRNFPDLKKLFTERYSKYLNSADFVIINNDDIDKSINQIIEKYKK